MDRMPRHEIDSVQQGDEVARMSRLDINAPGDALSAVEEGENLGIKASDENLTQGSVDNVGLVSNLATRPCMTEVMGQGAGHSLVRTL